MSQLETGQEPLRPLPRTKFIPNDVGDTIEVDNTDDGYLYTAQEVEAGITVKEENEDDITTNSEEESDARFDYDLESSFNNDVDGNEDEQDEDIE